jgi:hypothetical protein
MHLHTQPRPAEAALDRRALIAAHALAALLQR